MSEKINIKSIVTYTVEINKEIEIKDISDKEDVENTLSYEAWKMIKDGDFSKVDVEFSRVI
jgi:hypothetical protein